MIRIISFICLTLIFGNVFAADLEAGKAKAESVCAACHNNDGNSVNPIWPKLAGQHPKYLKAQLEEFRKGPKGNRNEPTMYGMAVGLSDADIENLSQYFAGQTGTMGKAKSDKVELGEKIYRGGNAKSGVSACIACHGPSGHGNKDAWFPKLAGQHAEYTVLQLKAFKSGARANDYNEMMGLVAKNMTEEEMVAVASYIEGLKDK